MSPSKDITLILQDWSNGDEEALKELMPLVYDELHKQATGYLRKERNNHTLQTSALINEAYIKLVDKRDMEFKNRAHFFAVASILMRRILVDYARTKNRQKRGGEAETFQLNEEMTTVTDEQNVDLVALDEALTRLEEYDERQARIVELRYFSGLSLEETAEALNISRTTVTQDWAMAKAWLFRELTK